MRFVSSIIRRSAPQSFSKRQGRAFSSLGIQTGNAAAARTRAVDASEKLATSRAEEVDRCASKSWKSALVCLGNMRKGGVAPGTRAYNVALKACITAQEWDPAAALVADMEATGATPEANALAEVHRATAPRGGAPRAPVTLTAFADVVPSGDGAALDTLKAGKEHSAHSNGNANVTTVGAGGSYAGGADGSWPSRRSSSESTSRRAGGTGRTFGSVAGDRHVSADTSMPWGVGRSGFTVSSDGSSPRPLGKSTWGED